MLDRSLFTLPFAAAIGSLLVAGVFFAFSSFVMALGRILPDQGVAAMNSIDVTVINPGFMTALFGTGLACLPLALGPLFGWRQPGQPLILIASLIYIIGSLGVTMVCNVPLNDALAAAEPNTPQATALWTRYLSEWVLWNHVRTIASLASGIMFVAALIQRSAPS
jgi:uncharacterized membrane protein